MKTVYDHIKTNYWFFIPYLAFLLILGPIILCYPKTDLHLALNAYNSPFGDHFFKIITHLGDGSIPFILAGVLLFISYRKSMQMALTGTLTGIIAQVLKRMAFSDILRPYAILKDKPDFHLVQGVEMNSLFSFPSGHTATIFSICLCLAFFTKSRFLKFALLITAIVVAYSRVYLSQHFLADIYFGSILGIVISIPILLMIEKSGAQYLNRSVVSNMKRSNNE